QGPHALGLAGTAHEAAGQVVRVDEGGLDPAVGDDVGASRLQRAADGAARLVRRVGAGVDVVVDGVGDEGAVLLHAGLEPRHRVVARVAGQELFQVVGDHAHRPAGRLRQEVADRRVAGVTFTAKVAADVDVVHQDAVLRDGGS